MIVLIDNYDSFTFNLVHYLGGLGADVAVHRNDKIAVEDVLAAEPDAIVLSPGPCTPNEAGICLDLIEQGRADRADPRRLPRPSGDRPGVRRQGGARARSRCTASCPRSATRARACSAASTARSRRRAITRWWSSATRMPDALSVTAETDDGLVMGLAHKTLPVHGVQFHPESIASEHGHLILKNFLELAAQWNAARGRKRALRSRVVTDDFKGLIAKVASGALLSREEAAHAFDRMMSGEATPSQMGGLLMALRVRGETVDEITGAVTAMRAKMLKVDGAARRDRRGRHRRRRARAPSTSRPARPSSWRAPACRSPSTATARCRRARARPTCSARSASRSSCAPDEIARCIDEAGIGFMFAPAHHPAMKNVGPTRVELGTRTIFNLLGPLSNPAGVQAPDDRRVLAAMDRADGAGAEEPRLRMRLGGARLRRARRDHHVGPDRTSRRWRTARCAPSRSIRRTSASRSAKPEALRGGDAETNATALMARAQGHQGPVPRRRAAQRRGGAGRRRQGQGSEGRRGAGGEVDRLRRGREAGSTGWSRCRTRHA